MHIFSLNGQQHDRGQTVKRPTGIRIMGKPTSIRIVDIHPQKPPKLVPNTKNDGGAYCFHSL